MEIDPGFDDIEKIIARKDGSKLDGLEYVEERIVNERVLEDWYNQISRSITPYEELYRIGCGLATV